jgi:hypothetical protein
MYEPPYNDDEAAKQAWVNFRRELKQTLAEGRNGDAVGLFMMLLGMPPEHLEGMKQIPMWPMFEAVAPTIAYDAAAVGEDGAVPVEKVAQLPMPTLVMDGGAGEFPFMRITAQALAKALPVGQHRTLEGQTHEVEPDAIALALIQFFES